MSWNPKSIRLTLFGTGQEAKAPDVDFEKVVEAPFSNMQTLPNRVIQRDALVGPYRVVLVQHEIAQRLDLVVVVDQEATETSAARDVFSSTEEVDEIFVPMAERAIHGNASYLRLAIGAEYLALGPTRDVAYEALGTALPQQDLAGASDFRYQINRPRLSSRTGRLMINRLATWAVLQRSIKAFSLESRQLVDEGSPEFLALLTTDINSPATFGRSFDAEECAALAKEFLALSHEIASKGDVR